MRFLSLNAFYSDFVKNFSKEKNYWDYWYLFASVTALGLGIALCVITGPVLINALMMAGASYSFAVFTAIISGLILLKLTADLLILPNLIRTAWYKAENLWNAGGLLAKFILACRVAGVTLGVYLSILVFPLITATLTSAAVPAGIASLTAVILSLGLVTGSHSLISKVGSLVGDLLSLSSKHKGSLLDSFDASKDGISELKISSDAFLNKAINAEMPRLHEDGAAFSEAVMPHVFNAK